MRCEVSPGGKLFDCVILSESPSGCGFSASSLKAAKLFRVKPATRDRVPIQSSITIPLKWQLNDDPAVAPAPPMVPSTSPGTSTPSNTTGQAPN
ncbi:energy transducer TonB [Caulobacter sp. S45]|uniref:energy transducer TonB n=1 Tax=Caulobacter sp. S45 TaxID=1641861 RepID=UPI0035301202